MVENQAIRNERGGNPVTRPQETASSVRDWENTRRHVNEYVSDIHQWAIEKGWFKPDEPFDVNLICTKLMLVVTELAEACEEVRSRKPAEYVENGKPEGYGVELADTVIRIFDLAGYLGFDLEGAINRKMTYNESRSHRHGGKAC